MRTASSNDKQSEPICYECDLLDYVCENRTEFEKCMNDPISNPITSKIEHIFLLFPNPSCYGVLQVHQPTGYDSGIMNPFLPPFNKPMQNSPPLSLFPSSTSHASFAIHGILGDCSFFFFPFFFKI